MSRITFVRFAFFLLCVLIVKTKQQIVHTQDGDIQGYTTDLAKIFYGIPYAQPPVKELRYWDKIKDVCDEFK